MPKIRKKELNFLSGEIESWLDAEIINHNQASKILELYEPKPSSLRVILFSAGGILLLLGGVSFIAAHWHELNKILRVCIILSGYLGSLTCYKFYGEKRSGKFFLMLATLIFGAGIYLITRMYNYKLSFASVLGWWLIEIILAAVFANDTWHVFFAQIISLIYLNEIDAVNFFALNFMNRPRIALLNFFSPLNAFALILALWGAWLKLKNRTAFNMNLLLTLLLLASRMSLCLGGTWTLIILELAGAFMSFMSKWHDTEIMGILMLGLLGLLLTWPEFWQGAFFGNNKNILAIVNALVIAGLMLVNIYRGHFILGIIFCAMLACRYFFDTLFGYLPKAWGFTLTGIILLAAGLYSSRKKY